MHCCVAPACAHRHYPLALPAGGILSVVHDTVAAKSSEVFHAYLFGFGLAA